MFSKKYLLNYINFSPSFYCSLETCPSRSCCVLQGNMMNTKQINKTFLVNTFNRILSLAKYFRLASDTDIFQNKSKNRPLFQAFWFFVCSRGNRKKKEMFFRKDSKTQLLIWSLNRTPWIINAKNTPKRGILKKWMEGFSTFFCENNDSDPWCEKHQTLVSIKRTKGNFLCGLLTS